MLGEAMAKVKGGAAQSCSIRPGATRLTLAALVTLVLWALVAAACTGSRATSRTIRVLVFNIHAGKDAASHPNLEAVAALVRTTGADLVLLQEVDRGTNRSGRVDQLEVLTRLTGLGGAFGRSLDYDDGLYGVAALARGGFLSERTEPLPLTPAQPRAGGAYEPRVALVTVAATGAGRIGILNTHLDASGHDTYRLQEVAHLVALTSPDRWPAAAPPGAPPGRLPLLVGGDLNAEPDSEVVRRLLAAGFRDAWAECGRGDGLTYPSGAPIKRIDYLLLSGPLACTDARVLETTISDHRPLLVTLRR